MFTSLLNPAPRSCKLKLEVDQLTRPCCKISHSSPPHQLISHWESKQKLNLGTSCPPFTKCSCSCVCVSTRSCEDIGTISLKRLDSQATSRCLSAEWRHTDVTAGIPRVLESLQERQWLPVNWFSLPMRTSHEATADTCCILKEAWCQLMSFPQQTASLTGLESGHEPGNRLLLLRKAWHVLCLSAILAVKLNRKLKHQYKTPRNKAIF